MTILNSMPQESKPMIKHLGSIETARASASRRIQQDELDRIEAVLTGYELDKANAKYLVREFCIKFGANHVAAWVLQSAESLGQSL